MKRSSRLGKGLASILSINEEIEIQRRIPVDEVVPNPYQPRRTFDPVYMEQLAESIRMYGVLHPIIVREKDGKYELVSGERRWRAAKMAGLQWIPAIVKDLSDSEVLMIALVENIQREDLNPVEKALAIKRLKEDLGLTDNDIAKVVGKDRSTITNTLRLLNLPMDVLNMLSEKKITEGHARVLLRLKSTDEMLKWAKRIVEENLSVRELENLISPKQKKVKDDEEFIKNVMNRIRNRGLKAKLKPGKRQITLELKFSSREELENFIKNYIERNA